MAKTLQQVRDLIGGNREGTFRLQHQAGISVTRETDRAQVDEGLSRSRDRAFETGGPLDRPNERAPDLIPKQFADGTGTKQFAERAIRFDSGNCSTQVNGRTGADLRRQINHYDGVSAQQAAGILFAKGLHARPFLHM